MIALPLPYPDDLPRTDLPRTVGGCPPPTACGGAVGSILPTPEEIRLSDVVAALVVTLRALQSIKAASMGVPGVPATGRIPSINNNGVHGQTKFDRVHDA